MAPKNPLDTPLAADIQVRAEQAHALRRVARTLESLLDELARIQAGLGTLPAAARDGQRARHRELRAEAEKYLWYLVVQREAMGLCNHDDVHALYRVPPPL
ncbi:MAG: hypothetical protein RL653_3318 [Pseudomonadota bacterium]|jgi:hypothetical protein